MQEYLQQEIENQYKRELLQSQIDSRRDAAETRRQQAEYTKLYRDQLAEDRKTRAEQKQSELDAKNRAFTQAQAVVEDPASLDVSAYPPEWQERVRNFELANARHFIATGEPPPKDVRDNFYKEVWGVKDGRPTLKTPEEIAQGVEIAGKEAEARARASAKYREPRADKPYAGWNEKQYGPATFPTGAQKWVYGITQRAKTMDEAMAILNDEFDQQVEAGNTHLSMDIAARKLAAAMRAKLGGKKGISVDLGALGGKPEGGLK
jgi:hypothetical protein